MGSENDNAGLWFLFITLAAMADKFYSRINDFMFVKPDVAIVLKNYHYYKRIKSLLRPGVEP